MKYDQHRLTTYNQEYILVIISLTKYKQLYYAYKQGSSYITAHVYLTVDLVLQQSAYCAIDGSFSWQ